MKVLGDISSKAGKRICYKIPKGLSKKLGKLNIRDWIETVQTKKKQVEYSEESWRPEKTCCHSNFSENLPVKTDVK